MYNEFDIVIAKRVQVRIMMLVIVQMYLPVDGVRTRSPKTKLVCTTGYETS